MSLISHGKNLNNCKRNNKKKSQITIEFVTIVALGLVISLSFTSFILHEINTNKVSYEYDSISIIGDVIKQEIDIASSSEDGYNRIFNLPEVILQKNYSISVYNNTLIAIKIDTREVLKSVHYFEGIIGKKNHISKENGVVSINS